MRSKNWFFTWNNPKLTLDELYETHKPLITFIKGQLEKGESGTPHLQFIIIFNKLISNKQLDKLGFACHHEVIRSLKASELYVSKLDTSQGGVFEAGEPPAGYGGDRKSAKFNAKSLRDFSGDLSELTPNQAILSAKLRTLYP